MDFKEHTKPANLLRYSFWWNEARLVVAAISLIWGATPLMYRLFSSGLGGFYTLFSLISGAAALYLLYEWNRQGRKLFGGNDTKDLVAFMVATLSGVHLGLGALFSTNFIMAMLGYSGGIVTLAAIVGGIVYLWAAFCMHKRFKENGGELFRGGTPEAPAPASTDQSRDQAGASQGGPAEETKE